MKNLIKYLEKNNILYTIENNCLVTKSLDLSKSKFKKLNNLRVQGDLKLNNSIEKLENVVVGGNLYVFNIFQVINVIVGHNLISTVDLNLSSFKYKKYEKI